VEGSSWREDMTNLLDSIVKPMIDNVGAGNNEGKDKSKSTGGDKEELRSYLGKDGKTMCSAPSTGPSLDYAAAVKRYLELPWSMRRKGAKTEPKDLSYSDENRTIKCFASPYVEGGDVDTAPCGLHSSVFYPTAPKPKGNASFATIPDLSTEKMAKCAAAKRSIARPKIVRSATLNSTYLPWIVKKNISCGPEQLCFYPKPLALDKGSYSEAVNTELGVEVRIEPCHSLSLSLVGAHSSSPLRPSFSANRFSPTFYPHPFVSFPFPYPYPFPPPKSTQRLAHTSRFTTTRQPWVS